MMMMRFSPTILTTFFALLKWNNSASASITFFVSRICVQRVYTIRLLQVAGMNSPLSTLSSFLFQCQKTGCFHSLRVDWCVEVLVVLPLFLCLPVTPHGDWSGSRLPPSCARKLLVLVLSQYCIVQTVCRYLLNLVTKHARALPVQESVLVWIIIAIWDCILPPNWNKTTAHKILRSDQKKNSKTKHKLQHKHDDALFTNHLDYLLYSPAMAQICFCLHYFLCK